MNDVFDKRDVALQTMMSQEALPAMTNIDLSMDHTAKIPLANLSALGVAFQPLATAVQTALNGSGGSGIYYVNTKGMQMFSTNEGFIGSLKSATGTVGGGQARMTALACDPTMLFMAATLMNIEKKLDMIQKTQEEILEFLEEKERANLQGNLNTLDDVMINFKYNWNNDTYKVNKHSLVQDIKKDADKSIALHYSQITKRLKKRSIIHTDQEIKGMMKKLQVQFNNYQMALYVYAYSTFLEVMLLGNFSEGYLNSVEQRISEYSYQYRALYTECYNLIESYSKTSVQAGVLSGLASAGKFMGNTIAKVPVINKSQLDENFMETSSKLGKRGEMRTTAVLEGIVQMRLNVTQPFAENIRTVNTLYNKPTAYLFDKENVYIHQIV